MIKYADRGLVDQGSLSFMIEYLYYLANLFYWSIGLTIDFSKYLSKGLKAEKQMKFLKICSRMIEKNETIISDKNENENHIHVVNNFLIILVLIIPVTILYLGVNHFIRRISVKGTKKFGNFQRNMVTFHQTVVIFLSSIFLLLLMSFIVNLMEITSLDRFI